MSGCRPCDVCSDREVSATSPRMIGFFRGLRHLCRGLWDRVRIHLLLWSDPEAVKVLHSIGAGDLPLRRSGDSARADRLLHHLRRKHPMR